MVLKEQQIELPSTTAVNHIASHASTSVDKHFSTSQVGSTSHVSSTSQVGNTSQVGSTSQMQKLATTHQPRMLFVCVCVCVCVCDVCVCIVHLRI